jgi:hypothetical protein
MSTMRCALARARARHVQRHAFADDLADRHSRRQRAERILEHDLIRRRIARNAGRSALSSRIPVERTEPAEIGCNASSAIPSVVFPVRLADDAAAFRRVATAGSASRTARNFLFREPASRRG